MKKIKLWWTQAETSKGEDNSICKKNKRARQCTYNVTWRLVRAATITVEKQ
jgi:hypothetical protein